MAEDNRWSYHLGSNPYGEYGEKYAKQWYDDPNIDPGAKVQEHLSGFRSSWGDAAPEDDMSLMQMIASGQSPEPRQSQSSQNVQPYPEQMQTITGTPRNTELYNLLLGRATQGLNVDRNNPVVRAQADAYAANEERARRNYISDQAEKLGPNANLRGDMRMAAERVGQRTGAFEASLLGRELQAKRDEIAAALEGMRGMLTVDQQLALQRELGLYDNALRSQQLSGSLSIQQGGLDLDRAKLGLEAENQASYWDWLRSRQDS